jgi:large subunit ribosomal protein L24
MKKFHIKKNDQVVVITGENKGSQGKVLEVYRKKDRALVEGVNMIKRHTKPSTEHPDGGIVEKEAPIHVSNLKLVDGGAK